MLRSKSSLPLACLMLAACAQAPAQGELASDASSEIEIEIADGRVGFGSRDDVAPWREAGPVLAAIESARRHWAGQESRHEEDVLVLATSTGAFTRAGTEQRVVLYRMSLYPRGFPRKGLALLEGDELVRNFAFTGLAHDVRALPDLDGDGLDELLLAGSFGMGGQTSRGASLATFRNGVLEDLGHATLYDDACGMDPERFGGPEARRLFAVPGGAMKIQRYSRESCESDTWQAVGEPEPFTPTPEKTYDEIRP